jgi:hypothetical protein
MPQTPRSISPTLTLTLKEVKTPGWTSTIECDETESPRPNSYIDLGAELSRCKLGQYLEVLVQNGFDTWFTVLEIQEGDLEAMGFKLGHRRKLQRHILNLLSHTTSLQIPKSALNISHAIAPSVERFTTNYRDTPVTSTNLLKRRYKYRPKLDANAPQKPKTGYILFSKYLRSDPLVATLPFDAIAKHVGHEWQLLSANERKLWEDLFTIAMLSYNECLDIYKRSTNYRKYQAYLANFKVLRKPRPSIDEETVGRQKSMISVKEKDSAGSTQVENSFIR